MMPEERFWNQVKEIDGCWIWQGYLNDDGYGRLRWKGRLILTHVLAYNLKVGEVPVGLELDHTCRNRACINVEHLEPVTHKENMRRGIAKNTKKTVCKRGHPCRIIIFIHILQVIGNVAPVLSNGCRSIGEAQSSA